MITFFAIRLLGMGFGPLAMLAVGSPWWASKACATTVVLLRSAPWRRIFRMYSLVLVVCAPGRGHVLPFAPVRRKQQGPSKPSWVPPPTPTIIHLLGHESDTSTPLNVPLKVVEPSHTALFELLGPGKRWFRDMVIIDDTKTTVLKTKKKHKKIFVRPENAFERFLRIWEERKQADTTLPLSIPTQTPPLSIPTPPRAATPTITIPPSPPCPTPNPTLIPPPPTPTPPILMPPSPTLTRTPTPPPPPIPTLPMTMHTQNPLPTLTLTQTPPSMPFPTPDLQADDFPLPDTVEEEEEIPEQQDVVGEEAAPEQVPTRPRSQRLAAAVACQRIKAVFAAEKGVSVIKRKKKKKKKRPNATAQEGVRRSARIAALRR